MLRIGVLFPLSILFFTVLPLSVLVINGVESFGRFEFEIYLIALSALIYIISYLAFSKKTKFKKNNIKPMKRPILMKSAVYSLTPISLFLALKFYSEYGGEGLYSFGLVPPVPVEYQIIFYMHAILFFYSLAHYKSFERFSLTLMFVSVLVPRLVISMISGRWFVAQFFIPVVLIYLNCIMVSEERKFKQIAEGYKILLAASAFVVIFLIGVFREANSFNSDFLVDYFVNGGVVNIYKMHEEIIGEPKINYILASTLYKTFPIFAPDSYLIDVWGRENIIATLDRSLTKGLDPDGNFYFGTGSNYVYELYLSGGIFSVITGSVFLGFLASYLDGKALATSIGIYLYCDLAPKLLLLPRSNFGYISERLVIILLIYIVLNIVNGNMGKSRART